MRKGILIALCFLLAGCSSPSASEQAVITYLDACKAGDLEKLETASKHLDHGLYAELLEAQSVYDGTDSKPILDGLAKFDSAVLSGAVSEYEITEVEESDTGAVITVSVTGNGITGYNFTDLEAVAGTMVEQDMAEWMEKMAGETDRTVLDEGATALYLDTLAKAAGTPSKTEHFYTFTLEKEKGGDGFSITSIQ